MQYKVKWQALGFLTYNFFFFNLSLEPNLKMAEEILETSWTKSEWRYPPEDARQLMSPYLPLWSKVRKHSFKCTYLLWMVFCYITWLFSTSGKNYGNFENTFSLLLRFKKWFKKHFSTSRAAGPRSGRGFENHFLNQDNREKLFEKFP